MINRLTVVGRLTAVATVYISLIQPLWTVSDMVDCGSDLVPAGFFHPPHGRGSLSGMSQTLLALASTAGRPSGW